MNKLLRTLSFVPKLKTLWRHCRKSKAELPKLFDNPICDPCNLKNTSLDVHDCNPLLPVTVPYVETKYHLIPVAIFTEMEGKISEDVLYTLVTN